MEKEIIKIYKNAKRIEKLLKIKVTVKKVNYYFYHSDGRKLLWKTIGDSILVFKILINDGRVWVIHCCDTLFDEHEITLVAKCLALKTYVENYCGGLEKIVISPLINELADQIAQCRRYIDWLHRKPLMNIVKMHIPPMPKRRVGGFYIIRDSPFGELHVTFPNIRFGNEVEGHVKAKYDLHIAGINVKNPKIVAAVMKIGQKKFFYNVHYDSLRFNIHPHVGKDGVICLGGYKYLLQNPADITQLLLGIRRVLEGYNPSDTYISLRDFKYVISKLSKFYSPQEITDSCSCGAKDWDRIELKCVNASHVWVCRKCKKIK